MGIGVHMVWIAAPGQSKLDDLREADEAGRYTPSLLFFFFSCVVSRRAPAVASLSFSSFFYMGPTQVRGAQC